MSRASEALQSIPISTAFFGALCLLTYIFQILLNSDVSQFTMCPRRVIFYHEYYRIVSSPFFHGSLMHIGMNMLSYAALGKSLEKQFGSLYMTFVVINSIFMTSMLYIAIASIAYICGYAKFFNQHSLGFSCVLFHLLGKRNQHKFCSFYFPSRNILISVTVLESHRTPNAAQSIFGIFQVQSKYYPW